MTLDQKKKKKTLDLYLLNKFKIKNNNNNNNNWTGFLCSSEMPLNFIFNREKKLKNNPVKIYLIFYLKCL